MKINKHDIPVAMEGDNMKMCNQPGFGGMTIAYNEVPAGTDVTPLLEGLDHDKCHCPHWGYMLEGSVRVLYQNGSEEVLKAGELFYLPPGHTAIMETDAKFVEFSPEKEFNEVLAHIAQKMEEMSA